MGFADQIENFADKTEQQLDRIVRKSALALFSHILQYTPVDTGRARGNWMIELDQAGSGGAPFAGGQKSRFRVKGEMVTDKVIQGQNAAAATQTAVNNAENELAKFKSDTRTITIYNNLDYIVPLEYGSSEQAPKGMVRLACQEFPGIVAKLSQGEEP